MKQASYKNLTCCYCGELFDSKSRNKKQKACSRSCARKMKRKDEGGRPPIIIEYKTLEKLCMIACTGEECAAILGIDYDTLNAHLKDEGHVSFSEYLKKHGAKGKMSLRRKQFEVANAGSIPMLIWLGKQQLGQADKSETSLSGPNGGPIAIAAVELSDDQLAAMIKGDDK